jgi:hypothetical protein
MTDEKSDHHGNRDIPFFLARLGVCSAFALESSVEFFLYCLLLGLGECMDLPGPVAHALHSLSAACAVGVQLLRQAQPVYVKAMPLGTN